MKILQALHQQQSVRVAGTAERASLYSAVTITDQQ